MRYRVYGVLAGAYTAWRVNGQAVLSHLCTVDDNGHLESVACKRVKLENISDYEDRPGEPPTCKSCLREWEKLGGQQ